MARIKIDGREWVISFDADTLDEIQRQTELDLGDLAASGWERVVNHSPTAARVLSLVIDAEQYRDAGSDPVALRKLLRGELLMEARAVLMEAGADFFPASEWSAIRSALKTLEEYQATAAEARGFAAVLGSLPEGMQQGALQEMTKMIKRAVGIDLSALQASTSAAGQGATPSSAATDLQGPSGSAPEGAP